MNNPYIKSSQHTRWLNQREAVTQPNGIDYSQLLESMQSKETSKIREANSPIKKDLRKKSSGEEIFSKEDRSLDEVDKGSIIPVPGLMIEHENSESDMKPPESDWVAPHGQQWNPMTF